MTDICILHFIPKSIEAQRNIKLRNHVKFSLYFHAIKRNIDSVLWALRCQISGKLVLWEIYISSTILPINCNCQKNPLNYKICLSYSRVQIQNNIIFLSSQKLSYFLDCASFVKRFETKRLAYLLF